MVLVCLRGNWCGLSLQDVAAALDMLLILSLDEVLHLAELAVHGKLGAFHADDAAHDLHLLLIDERVDRLSSPPRVLAKAAVALLGGATTFSNGVD